MERTLVLGFLGNLGWFEILLILVVVLLLFGARKLPELAHSMGSSIQSFKKGLKEGGADSPQLPDANKDEPKVH